MTKGLIVNCDIWLDHDMIGYGCVWFGLRNHSIQNEEMHHEFIFLKFGGMTIFFILVLTNYDE